MKSNLFKRGFLSLVMAQFFGAMNDNILKAVLIFMVISLLGMPNSLLNLGKPKFNAIVFVLFFYI